MEAFMSLDKIVVLILALMFFGGLAYVIWKGRQEGKSGSAAPGPSPEIPTAVQDNPPGRPQRKKRRVPKS